VASGQSVSGMSRADDNFSGEGQRVVGRAGAQPGRWPCHSLQQADKSIASKLSGVGWWDLSAGEGSVQHLKQPTSVEIKAAWT
jgi:hypothetical protein